MENPVETGTEKEDDVGLFKGSAPGTGGVQGVSIRKDAFAHWGREERDLGLGDEAADGISSAGVSSTFTNDDKRGVGCFQELGDFEERSFVG